jgi:hypothetical protein
LEKNNWQNMKSIRKMIKTIKRDSKKSFCFEDKVCVSPILQAKFAYGGLILFAVPSK